MRPALRTEIIVLVAALGFIAVCAVTIAVLPLRNRYAPADVLPAARTQIYASNIRLADLPQLSALVPELGGAPLTDVPADVALVTLENNATAWITFSRDATGKPVITATDQRAMALLGTGDALGRSDTYKSTFAAEGTVRVYARLPYLQVPHGRTTGDAGIVTSDGTALRIGLIDGSSRLPVTEALMRTVPSVLTLQAGDGLMIAQALPTFLPGNQWDGTEAILRAKLRAVFGPDISPAYDLLPLLDGPATLFMAVQSGTTVMALESTNDNARATLDTLHTAAGASAASVREMERVFDETFSIRTLQPGSGAAADTQRMDGGWTVRSTSGLHSAQLGRRFILSNNAALLNAVLRAPMETAQEQDNAIARGTVNLPELQRIMTAHGLNLPALPVGNDNFSWSITQKGNLSILTINAR